MGSTTTKPPPSPSPSSALDAEGRFRVYGNISYGVVGAYVLLLVLVVFLIFPKVASGYLWVPYLLVSVTVLLLARYLSTVYTINDSHLRAWRILGGRKIALEEVRRIEFASLRDLAPIAGGVGLGSWGWHGRMFSPTIGEFDSVYTDAAHGLLVTAGALPLYLSPKDPDGFARELSRRVRSYTGPLLKDVGDPQQRGAPQ